MFSRYFTILTALIAALIAGGCRKNITPESTADVQYETLPPVLTPVTENINTSIGGYYSGVPAGYANTNTKYPLLLFMHGGGQFGNGQIDLPIILNEGVPELLDEKRFPADFNINGEHFSFVVLAPQFRSQPSNRSVKGFVDYAFEHFRVDSDRVYIIGMSNGGKIACDVAADYPDLFAAVVPMAGVPDSTDLTAKTGRLAKSDMPIWVFHNDSDQVIDINLPRQFIGMLNSYHPIIPPRFTELSPMGLLGHDAWTRATDPDYKENDQNIYQWMLSYHR